MSPLVWSLLVVGVVMLLIGWWLSWTARRLDRLHHRLDLARASLVAQLQQRAALALEVGAVGLLDPASSLLLVDAAATARQEGEHPDRAPEAQSHLSQILRSVLPDDPETAALLARLRQDEGARALLAELAAASRKVELARRFHNDQVQATRALRSRRRTRWFALAGKAPEPRTVDFDDLAPAVFAVETGVGARPNGSTLDPPPPPTPEDTP